ncbi:Basic leucine zipper and W2 domain-containing protein 1 [Zancudomyces culisetae]|uniref:Basic leucine zipper and W2 domain-containing protein 1 n=1 Tax=Zancudomyces culisetae TaxID=1213189 RepID=A0A1R1PN62_ZANCU|nr:Basic leucine zipper and W2 domain-containing protein 1 [Zancudomyces culisetae]OMH83468.1 Basic leucine zipper and W2 domain-containing protein 1 [Zancudomyces culisetae]|eukprot:OMH82399.1 Basic leucine zipper and W2 domain-containing protein 1 [Zancudomyces culisetae]
MARGLIGFESIKVLQKEHLNKDGYGLTVLTGIMRAYLGEKSIESLFVALEKIKADSLLDFFPFNKRMDEYFVRHFEAEDMRAVIDYVAARKAESARDAVYSDLFERLQSGASAEDLAKAARRAMTAHSFTPAQMATLLWDAILSYLRSSSDLVAEQQQFIAEVRKYSDSLLVFTDSAKAEMALLQHLQKSFYEDASLMKFFASVVRVFYEEDVLSNDAILFWAKKGALSQGKSTFMKQMSKFIDYLEQQSE